MATTDARDTSNNKRIWLWVSLLMIILAIIKLLFLGTYYVDKGAKDLPSSITPHSLLFVTLQESPHTKGEILLLEMDEKKLLPAVLLSRNGDSLLVEISHNETCIMAQQVRGKVIGGIKL